MTGVIGSANNDEQSAVIPNHLEQQLSFYFTRDPDHIVRRFDRFLVDADDEIIRTVSSLSCPAAPFELEDNRSLRKPFHRPDREAEITSVSTGRMATSG